MKTFFRVFSQISNIYKFLQSSYRAIVRTEAMILVTFFSRVFSRIPLPPLQKSKETYGQTHGLINSSQKQFTCFYKMFCCFQHFSSSNIVKLIVVLLT